MKELFWKFFIKVKNQSDLDKTINIILSNLESSEVLLSKEYWKDNSLHELCIKQSLKSDNYSIQIFETLQNIEKFSNLWNIEFPADYSETNYDISGVTLDKIRFNNVEWISFDMQKASSQTEHTS